MCDLSGLGGRVQIQASRLRDSQPLPEMKPLDILIRALSAATWHLSAIRSRRQCEADHLKAERQAEAETLRPLACSRCHALYGAPPDWPSAVCPACRREILVPKP